MNILETVARYNTLSNTIDQLSDDIKSIIGHSVDWYDRAKNRDKLSVRILLTQYDSLKRELIDFENTEVVEIDLVREWIKIIKNRDED